MSVEAFKALVGLLTSLAEKIMFNKHDNKMEANMVYPWLHQFYANFFVTP